MLGFNPKTGKQLWECKTDIGWYMAPSLVAHEGQSVRLLQEKATRYSCLHDGHRTRVKPHLNRPHFRYARSSCSTYRGRGLE